MNDRPLDPPPAPDRPRPDPLRFAGAPPPINPGKAVPRCVACGLHVPICLCGEVTPLATRTRVVVVMHRHEWHRTSNSGRLTAVCLTQGAVRVRGNLEAPLDLSDVADPTRRVVALYPREGAAPLSPEWIAADPRPVTLVVPDGNWKQAGRTLRREGPLATLPCVRLPEGRASAYRLRSHPDPVRLATFEAIARALGVLEGEPVAEQLLHWFQVFVDRSLWCRGVLPEAEVTAGIPRKDW